MGGSSKNVLLDKEQRTEGRDASTQVKQFGGSRPRELNGCYPVLSQQSSPTCAASPTTFSPSSTVASAIHPTFSRKERHLLAVLPPASEEGRKLRSTQGRRDSAVKTGNGQLHRESSAGCSNEEVANIEDDGTLSQNSLGPQPLEERLCLQDLQQLMYFFSTKCKAFEGDMAISRDSVAIKSLTEEPSRGLPRKLDRSCQETGVGGSSRARLSEAQVVLEDKPMLKKYLTGFAYAGNSTEEDPDMKAITYQPLTVHAAKGLSSYREMYTRVLTEEEFAQAVRSVLPTATNSDVMELMKKVDYEAKKQISWDDFATYLLSRGQHRSNLVQGTISEILSRPEPKSCVPSMRHIIGTCMEINARRKLLLTGGSEGTVRAWDLKTLTSCGIVYAGDCWVVGVHWADSIQCILIVTMDRKLIVLDSKTLEVKRLYRGRPVVDTAEGHMYAHDSVHSVKVGGKIKPKCKYYYSSHESKGASGVYNVTTTTSTNGNINKEEVLPPVRRPKEKRGKDLSGYVVSLATPGTGPYLQCRVEECILAGLIDAVSCSLFHHTALREDMLLLATVIGEVRFYAIPKTTKRLVAPHAVVRLHEKRINKMSIMFDTYSLLTASDDGTVKMTSLDTGALLRTFATSGPEQHSAVHDFAVNSQLRFLVTIGPERYGIVWDFSHDTPMAVLDAHNSPCRSCAVHLKQNQIFTSGTDGTIFIFDTQGFRLIQVLHVPNLNPQRIMYDEPRLRLLCLASYPYFHGQQRYAVSACASKYQGHMVSMVGVIYNKTYDLIITIDIEGLVMTWKRSDGSPVFTFQLREFSDSAVLNASRLTCFALDGLERRLLTGFQNGAVAVWNVVNGQTTNVITAAAESFARSTIRPEVTALGSLTRDGITFFIFAAAEQLFITRESSTFTIASASKWEVPKQYGEVLAMYSASPQIIVCGTSSGALFFYHILAERQEGSPLWVVDAAEPVRRSVQPSLYGRRSDNQGTPLTSRILKIFSLEEVGAHILMTVHSDGTVALWHTLRRLLMETVNVRRAFPSKEEESGLSHVVLDKGNQHFVFVDDIGNIHVCGIRLQAAPDEGSMRLLNQQTHPSREGKTAMFWPGSPFDSPEFADFLSSRLHSPEGKKAKESDEQPQRGMIDEEKTPYVFAEFTRNYVFHCGLPSVSGIAIVGDPTQADTSGMVFSTEATTPEKAEGSPVTTKTTARQSPFGEHETDEEGKDSSKAALRARSSAHGGSFVSNVPFAFAPPTKYGGLIVVTSAADNFTRVFLLDGTIVGECGMNTWKLGAPSTYEFLGSKPTRRLPPHYCNVEVIDFLQDSQETEKNIVPVNRQNRFLRGVLKTSKPHRDGSVTPEALTQRMSSNAEVSSTLPICHTTGNSEFSQGEACNVQSPSMELFKSVGHKHHEVEKEKSRLPQTSKPFFTDENMALSTRIRSRRSREGNLYRLVKSEYISKLRGVPMAENEEDSITTDIPSVILSGTKRIPRVDQGNESLTTVFTPSNSSNVLKAGGSGITEVTCMTAETPNSPPSVTLTPRNFTHHGSRTPQPHMGLPGVATPSATVSTTITESTLVTGQMAATTTDGMGGAGRKMTVLSVMERDAARVPTTSIGRSSIAFNDTAAVAEAEVLRTEMIQEHMRSKRRMLISLGRTDPVLEVTLPYSRASITSSSSGGTTGGGGGRHTGGERFLRSPRRVNPLTLDARGYIAQITTQLRVVHVEPMLPPEGTRARKEHDAWYEKVNTMSNTNTQTGK